MLVPFYQRVVPSNHLVHVGDFDVGDRLHVDMRVYQGKLVFMEGPHLVAPKTKGQMVSYSRKSGEMFDCFIADVPIIKET